MNLEFKVQEYSRGDGTHHWEAVDCLNGKKLIFLRIMTVMIVCMGNILLFRVIY